MAKPLKKIYQFKVTLEDIQPPIWRRIQVPDHYSFWDLHVAIQDSMGWVDSHLHAFLIRNPNTNLDEEIGIPDDESWDDKETLSGWDCKIKDYFTPDNDTALYTYDFGDDWHHIIRFEKKLPLEQGMRYPVCIAGKRACPPEDCGGVFGYEDLLKVLSDPEHEEYEDRIEWLGGSFDPEAFDTADVVFDDPEERFEYAFSESDDFMDDDFDEDDELDESEEDLEPFRASSRDYIHDLWEKVKADDLDDLSIEELRLARIIKEHEDEFFNQFEFADVTHDHQFDPETETNPFLHIFIHLTVENQLANKDPIEVFQFLNAMKKKRCSHHEIVHMIGAILAPLMLSIMHEQRPFDQDIYTSLLKKYKNRNPDKFFDLLENEKGLYPDE